MQINAKSQCGKYITIIKRINKKIKNKKNNAV